MRHCVSESATTEKRAYADLNHVTTHSGEI
jgi:hypothetical protein